MPPRVSALCEGTWSTLGIATGEVGLGLGLGLWLGLGLEVVSEYQPRIVLGLTQGSG